mmetsp:Transcript_22328/g.69462  ORF Transcript_22328/g.69462 Transcript_22328/m.69462 type:complete len:307 (-) Transcript_22328:1624-2544(-)
MANSSSLIFPSSSPCSFLSLRTTRSYSAFCLSSASCSSPSGAVPPPSPLGSSDTPLPLLVAEREEIGLTMSPKPRSLNMRVDPARTPRRVAPRPELPLLGPAASSSVGGGAFVVDSSAWGSRRVTATSTSPVGTPRRGTHPSHVTPSRRSLRLTSASPRKSSLENLSQSITRRRMSSPSPGKSYTRLQSHLGATVANTRGVLSSEPQKFITQYGSLLPFLSAAISLRPSLTRTSTVGCFAVTVPAREIHAGLSLCRLKTRKTLPFPPSSGCHASYVSPSFTRERSTSKCPISSVERRSWSMQEKRM